LGDAVLNDCGVKDCALGSDGPKFYRGIDPGFWDIGARDLSRFRHDEMAPRNGDELKWLIAWPAKDRWGGHLEILRRNYHREPAPAPRAGSPSSSVNCEPAKVHDAKWHH
jgi:hypothetical protein